LLNRATETAYIYLKKYDVPKDFFVVTPYALESVRYRWAGVAKVFDYLGIPTDEKSKLPTFMLDGRIQPQEFDWRLLKPADFQAVEILSPAHAARFYGNRAKNGLVIFRTKNYKINDQLSTQKIRVIGEKHKKDDTWQGKWETISDTVLNNLAAFEDYHKHILEDNGSIYMIDNKPETEEVNRANIDLDKVENMYVKMGKKVEINDNPIVATQLFKLRNDPQKRAMLDSAFKAMIALETPDTVFIKMYKGRNWQNVNLPSIMSKLVRMRKTQLEPKPLYILNDKEVSLDDLKNYKNADFEKVTVLEGYEAYQAYGKKGEFGVVVYQLKK
jgi:hypothetical protein